MRAITLLTLAVVLAACEGDTDGTDETTDTDAVDTDAGDTDAGDTDAGDTDAGDTDAGDTEVSGTDEIPPELPELTDVSYTSFFPGGNAINVYWTAASDDVTPAEDLEYQVYCQAPGALSGEVTMSWTVAGDLQVEGSGRYWVQACVGTPGTYTAWVAVRDAAGNEATYPELSNTIVSGPK